MAGTDFLHGVDVAEMNDGVRVISTVRSSVIGVVGTAPDADPLAFPLDRPVLVTNPREAAKLGASGTLAQAMDSIYDQGGALTVAIRVAQGLTPAETLSNVIGSIDPQTGAYKGVKALLSAESIAKMAPKILIAPGFTHNQAVVAEMLGIADRLRAIIVPDGPNTNDADAMAYVQNFGSARVYVVDPWVKVWDTVSSAEIARPASAAVAGIISRVDNDEGFWVSPSNKEIYGITGTTRPIDFTLGDTTSRANLLNEKKVATIIQQDGYRLWGNRSASMDPKWTFLCVRRTADMINESLLRAHLWAVDRGITRTYFDDVMEGVNAYLRSLKARGAILGGKCWVDKSVNGAEAIKQGHATWDFDFTPVYPAERVTFRSRLVDDYIEELFK